MSLLTPGRSPPRVKKPHGRRRRSQPIPTIRSLDALEAWIARAHDVGHFAFDAKANSIIRCRRDLRHRAGARPNDAC